MSETSDACRTQHQPPSLASVSARRSGSRIPSSVCTPDPKPNLHCWDRRPRQHQGPAASALYHAICRLQKSRFRTKRATTRTTPHSGPTFDNLDRNRSQLVMSRPVPVCQHAHGQAHGLLNSLFGSLFRCHMRWWGAERMNMRGPMMLRLK